MPVIRPAGHSGPIALVRKQLTDILVMELMGEEKLVGEGRQRRPVIFEIPSEPPNGNSIDVIVVWEAWRDLSPQDRSTIIRDAYAQYTTILENGIHYIDPTKKPVEPLVPPLAGIVIGATWEDVERLNLLPYVVEPQVRLGDGVESEVLELVMIDSGAIQTPRGVQLRFPDQEMASQIQARLNEEMPEVRWVIVSNAGSADALRDS